MTRGLFDAALMAAKAFHAATPALAEFVPWPDDIAFAPRAAHAVPAIAHLRNAPGTPNAATRRLQAALIELAPHVEWRHTYSEAEVGLDFLQRYGWFELVGPDGHFTCATCRVTVGYWGSGLFYDWHHHRPEEIYSVVSGGGRFLAQDSPPVELVAGGTRRHESFQPHALETGAEPLLALVFWRGDGLSELPAMVAE